MTYKTRQAIFFAFVLLFLIATPLIILYANGYNLNLTSGHLEKTGIIQISTEPKGALIYIDGKMQSSFLKKLSGENQPITTPAKLTRIAPGKHEISVFLEGYWEWERKMNLREGESIALDDILLFSRGIPVLMMKTEELDRTNSRQPVLISSPANRFIAADLPGSLLIYDQENENSREKTWPQPTSTALMWSPDGQQILSGTRFYDIAREESLDINKTGSADLEHCRWNDNGQIFCQTKQEIFSWSKENGLLPQASYSGKIFDFLFHNNSLEIISEHKNGLVLASLSADGTKTGRTVELPDAAQQSRFMDFPNGLTNIYDPQQKNLYLIDINGIFPIIDVIKNADLFAWNSDDKLLFANVHELWLYDRNQKTKKLIARLAGEITGLTWHPRAQHAIFTTRESVNIIELGYAGKIDRTELFRAESVSSPVITNDKTGILFYAKIGSRAGIYKLGI